MRTWMVTWNPDLWDWPAGKPELVRDGGEFVEGWSFSFRNDAPKKGDRVFVKRTKSEEDSAEWPNGIVAAGHISEDGFHDEVDVNGGTTSHVRISFDWILEDLSDPLPIADLKTAFPDFRNWEPRNCGTSIDADPYKLELMWAEKIGYEHDMANVLRASGDIDQYGHDPAYELIQKAVDLYADCDFDSLTFKDLDFVYMMVHILKDQTKRKRIEESTLPHQKKDEMLTLFDACIEKWGGGEYSNHNPEQSCGLFKPGFNTFDRKGRDDDLPTRMIKLLVKVKAAQTREEAYKVVEDSDVDNWVGIATGSLSEMLHCLRPEDFPVMNSNEGLKDIYTLLLPNKEKSGTITDYVEWTRELAQMKDSEFPFRNFRVIDLAQRLLGKKDGAVDYVLICSAMKKHAGDPWQKSNAGLSQADAAALAELNADCDAAKRECKKLIAAIERRFGLKSARDVNFRKREYSPVWHIRDYTWLEFKDPTALNSPISVSLFPESIGGKGGRMAVSVQLEIYEAKADAGAWASYHKHLDLPLNIGAGLGYSGCSNQYSNVEELNQQVAQLRSQIADGSLKKVKINKTISVEPPATNEGVDGEVMSAIEAILPYYEYCVGLSDGAIPHAAKQDLEDTNMAKDERKIGLNTILYGPPGTGKTYNAVVWAVAICEQGHKTLAEVEAEAATDDGYKAVKARYDAYVEEGRAAFITFHQSYGYEDFIEGIKPRTIENEGKKEVIYETLPGIFKAFCEKAREDSQPHVFVIDEINRGNISKIFGELITLIEESKREGGKEQMQVKLPYSGKSFSVPGNVFILGTMNTADRSIALMDTALRRRFQFVEKMPNAQVLRDKGCDKVSSNGKEFDVAAALEQMNTRIEVLYDREHTLGHALFMGLKNEPTLEKLSSIFRDSIIPLLQEYFYEDYEKIQLVLGDNAKPDDLKFVRDFENKPAEVFRGNSGDQDIPDKRYKIQGSAFDAIESYIEIVG